MEFLKLFPSENSQSQQKPHLLKPCFNTSIAGSEAMLPCQNLPQLNALSFSVSFNGWRLANTNFKSWARKMAALHEPIWRKAGIFEAVMASIYRIRKNPDLVLGVAEKWCPDTNTFVFSWGETTITLEDVMVLLGFSVLGSPVFAALDSSGEKIMTNLKKEWLKIKKDKVSFVTQVAWVERFMNSGGELEHVAFLVLWLSYFVFPSSYYHIYEAILPIAVHLSSGTKIALAPAVLAHLYAELSLLKNHIEDFRESTITARIDLTALFKLVQVWTWERFKELQPKPNPLLKGEPRLALWHDLKQRTSNAEQILESSKIDSFEWRPYTKTMESWELPKFYPEKAIWIPAGPNLDDEFISFVRCITVSQLVGIDNVENYFPNRVASQFGMLQDVPCPISQNNLSHEAAWNDYNKPINDLALYIPSRFAIPRVTPTFCEWWRKSFPELQYSSGDESAEKLKARNIIGDDTSFVPSGVGIKITEESTNKRHIYIKQARDKRLKYMKQARENGSKMKRTSEDGMSIAEDSNKRRKYMKQDRENDSRCQAQESSEDDSLTIAQLLKLNKKYSGGDASQPLGKKCILEAHNNDFVPCQKLVFIKDETVQPPEIEKRNEEADESGCIAGKNTAVSPFDKNNSSDSPFGANEGVVDIAENEDNVVDHDDSLIQKKVAIDELAIKPDNNEPILCQKLAYESKSPSNESNIHIAVADETHGQERLLHDDGLGSEDLEKRNDGSGEGNSGNDSDEKRFQTLKVLESSMEERIIKAHKTVAWLIERKNIKERRLAAAARLI
ncbi:LOW QUALITY PROTEIN: uncharacterized protein LOC110224459 [Arabidopsis lyrata subsp. lyrata]|uniref:LOW QUALITY PROTEIN: uncharacterized protein LOC110224459 n=1 Tax=Arabidopsis lyrata subsp. lyrata TaxID=81972 RepID=UPI000A29B28F|nr:LOW QUALITY PROTEIN: uncharacterized protein LOC110224459 [Arabidopsis lyrata subsp. lyrata]|eukprot:XP_020866200.1 LOW QUALITY PROTEIN: uncharacterized protein LOC110224459 [Arabidopsis lyrata subsp. lyrata]